MVAPGRDYWSRIRAARVKRRRWLAKFPRIGNRCLSEVMPEVGLRSRSAALSRSRDKPRLRWQSGSDVTEFTETLTPAGFTTERFGHDGL